VRLQLPPQHELNADLKAPLLVQACNSEIVPEEAAPTQIWHRDKVDMGFGKGKPTARVMSQPADALGYRWLGVRKLSEPNNQHWAELNTPAYILWPLAAGTLEK
jgi:hypothetical protein